MLESLRSVTVMVTVLSPVSQDGELALANSVSPSFSSRRLCTSSGVAVTLLDALVVAAA